MMARVKVKVERGNGLQQVVVIDTAATQGARLGRDVYLPDGAVATPASMRNWMGVSQGTAAPTAGSSLQSVLTNKGDLATRNSQVQRLGIGTQDQALRVSAAGLPEWRSGAALTKQDDTNVTLTLNGEPGNALLDGVELELGWEGTLAPDRGGWGADISAADGYAKFTDGVAAFSNTVPWGDIDDTPDTLAGYGITDAYTMAQVDALFTDMENYFLPDNYQPLSATLTDLAMLGDAEGVLTNDGYGNLSWDSGGSTYTAGDGLTLAGDEFSVDEAFNFTWTGQHLFTGSSARDGVAKAGAASWQWLVNDATTNNGRWDIEAINGQMYFRTLNDAYSDGHQFLNITRSGMGVTGMTYGNSTDEPTQSFYGSAVFYGDPSSSAVLARAYSPSGAAYLGAFSDNASGDVGINMTNGTRTWYMYHTGSALTFYTGGAPQAQLRTDGALRCLGIASADDARYIAFNNTSYTYGSAYVGGAVNGWHGLAIADGSFIPTFMSSGGAFGVYSQNSGYWAWHDNGTHFSVAKKLLDYTTGTPYVRVASGGSASGGNITISTSAPSGTPADGDIWIQRAA